MSTTPRIRKYPVSRQNILRGLPWHWLFGTMAFIAAFIGAWILWGPMPKAKQLPPPPVERLWLRDVAATTDPNLYQHRQVELVGRFTGHTVMLEGNMAGRSGFYVLAPLAEMRKSYVDGAQTGLNVLVQLGWVSSRERAQAHRLVKHDLIISGRLAIPTLGDDTIAAGETGLFRRNLSLQRYASEIGVPLIPMVILQEPNFEWTDESIRQSSVGYRWPELYPQDKYRGRKGWTMLILAAPLAAFGINMRRRRNQNSDSAFAETAPYS